MINRISDSSASVRLRVARLLEPASLSLAAEFFRSVSIATVVAGVAGIVLISDPVYRPMGPLLVDVPIVVFALEYLCRLWIAPELVSTHGSARRSRWRWATSPMGIVDVLAVVSIPLARLVGVEAVQADMLGVFWIFKLARYSHGLAVLGRVIRLEAEPLGGVLLVFVVVLLCASVLIYLIEGTAQPSVLGTIPKAMWWTIVTITTTGYGDVTPVTVGGRVLAGLVMMCGIIVFALWAGILTTGFSQEMRRRAFLKTWDLVAQVPLFHDVGATVISEIAQRLRPCEVAVDTVVLRQGDLGDCMYFIVRGEITIEVGTGSVLLHDGNFFGELALITGGRRNANAVATRACQLLLLDIADFRDMVARHPELAAAIRQEAERRIRGGGSFLDDPASAASSPRDGAAPGE